MKEQFKEDILRRYIDLLEIGGHERQDGYRHIVFRKLGITKPLVIGSDDHADDRYHSDSRYPADKPCWIKADPTFAGLRMALREPEHRFCLDAVPGDISRIAKNKTRYIKALSFIKLPTMPDGEEWLHGELALNPGLVAVIGNKGSGKSALADCIGLLGSCETHASFSFLDKARFLNQKTGRAQHVEATIHWHDGDPVTRRLDEQVEPDEPERVKYLPQNFVEDVCNDMAMPGGGNFEKALKEVVFSKIPQDEQDGQHSLDSLIEFRTEVLREQAEDLAKELRDLARARADLEERLDPEVKSGVEKKIEQKKAEIKSHKKNRPHRKPPPSANPSAGQSSNKDIEALNELKLQREKIADEIAENARIAQEQGMRAANARKLLDKLENLKRSVDRSIEDMAGEADAIGLDAKALVMLAIERDPVIAVQSDALSKRNASRKKIEGTGSDSPDGLTTKRDEIDKQIKVVQERLSLPQKEYEQYLEDIREWKAIRKELHGNDEEPDSLTGLKAGLRALGELPTQIVVIDQQQTEIAKGIHSLRVSEASIYTNLYKPLQRFIEKPRNSTGKLDLDFEVEVIEERFAATLLEFINQGRAGSFHGREDGEQVVKNLVAPVDWSDWQSSKEFLESVVEHLHYDKRKGQDDKPVRLSKLMAGGKSVADLYSWLYTLNYLRPQYRLKWDGKDVAQLSPGERGTLLLIFYLFVDDSELPLIIDQPEARHTSPASATKAGFACPPATTTAGLPAGTWTGPRCSGYLPTSSRARSTVSSSTRSTGSVAA